MYLSSSFEEIAPWVEVEGDHMIFAMHKVPVVAITSTGIFELINKVVHTKRDTLDLMDRDRLRALVDFLEQALYCTKDR